MKYSCIFWDFDGVIKESIEIKSQAFFQLFLPFGINVAKKIRQHHEENQGISRYEKFPIYFKWVGLSPDNDLLEKYYSDFRRLVFQGVIDAPWVPGVERYLRTNKYRQKFVLVSATPQAELEELLDAHNIASCFTDVFGAPLQKGEAVLKIIHSEKINPTDCLLIGDSESDFRASQVAGIAFLLRRTNAYNRWLSEYTGPYIEDFTTL